MKIRENQKSTNKIWQRTTYCLGGAILYSFLLICFGMYLYKIGTIEKITKSFDYLIDYSMIQLHAKYKSSPKRIFFDINYRDFQKLAYKRHIAHIDGILFANEKDYVPAALRYQDQSVRVNIRLKGDLAHDHLAGKKGWSFRVKTKGDNTFWGMKQFSLHHPSRRSYIFEWIYHQLLKREGVISLRYDFVDVIVNGEKWGIYALEEHFEKRLIEYNQRREGPIIRFNEDLIWRGAQQQKQATGRIEGSKLDMSGSFSSVDIDAFQTSKIISDPSKYKQFMKAVSLLESFRRGELKPSEVFDVQKLAVFFAIVDLCVAVHSTNYSNVRFYYNPITSRLEPIGFDGSSVFPQSSLTFDFLDVNPYIGIGDGSAPKDKYRAMILNDRKIFKKYIATLERITKPEYLDNFFSNVNEELEKNIEIIRSASPSFLFSPMMLYQSQLFIKTILNPAKGLHAYLYTGSDNHLTLNLGNIQMMPIQVMNVSYKDSVLFKPFKDVILPAKLKNNPVDYKKVAFTFPQEFVWSNKMAKNLKVHYKLLGTHKTRSEAVFPWQYKSKDFLENDIMRQKPNANSINFLFIDEHRKSIFVKKGQWDLDKNIIIPKGYKVIANKGTQINLLNAAKIISYSPLEFIGSDEDPISIFSKDSSGQGLVVMNATEKSVLKYVNFQNLSNPSQAGWELTGAITFYESPVDISYCIFANSRSEDALNIFHSEFTIDKTIFRRSLSDALDADFAKGKITNSSFQNCGNDAIDISGSGLSIENVSINGVGDKGLSIGEDSHADVNQIKISNAEIAITSKDMSELIMTNVKIDSSKLGLAAYQKKPEFGGGHISVKGLNLSEVQIEYLLEDQSSIVLNGRSLTANKKNIKDILYGAD